MKFFKIVKNYEWIQTLYSKEEDPKTGRMINYKLLFQCNSQRTNSYYLGITEGRAKRLARGHRLPFKPSACGYGWTKLKDKLYVPAATFKFNRFDRKLVISHNTYFKKKLISKKFEEDL